MLGLRSAGSPEARPRLVVMVLLDAARADRFSCYGYRRPTTPTIDALARGGLRFARHYSQGTVTRQSVPSLLYSRYFARPLFPFNPDVPLFHPDDLFQSFDAAACSLPRALAAAGYRTALVTAHPWMRSGTRIAEQFDEVHAFGEVKTADPSLLAAERTAELAAEARTRDTFVYLHLMEPHEPRFLREDAVEMLDGAELSAAARSRFDAMGDPQSPEVPLSRDERAVLDALYDGALHRGDRLVGVVMDRVRALGLEQQTLVAVVADHGESLLETPGRYGHGNAWCEAESHVPFVLSWPGRIAAGVEESFSENVDVAPTILGAIGIEAPTGTIFDGVDLQRRPAGDPRRHLAASAEGVRTASNLALLAEACDRALRRSPANDDVPSAAEAALAGEVAGTMYDVVRDPLAVHDLRGSDPQGWSRHVALFRRRLMVPWLRAQASRRGIMPRGPFALVATDFDPDGHDPGEQCDAVLVPLRIAQLPPLWTLDERWPVFFVRADPRAPATDLAWRVPDGTYELSISMSGAVDVLLPRGRAVRLQASRGGDAYESIPIGRVTVTEERLVLRFQPDPGRGVQFQYLSLIPEHPGGAAGVLTEPAPISDDTLRSLGYL